MRVSVKRILLVILVILILILLITSCNKRKEGFFDITCPVGGCKVIPLDNQDNDAITIDETNQNKNNNSNKAKEDAFENEKIEDGVILPDTEDVFVYDTKLIWKESSQLKIFEKTNGHVANSKIAPGSKGTYKFEIKNNTKLEILVGFTFNEENDHLLNIKYRLRTSDGYLKGDDVTWVTYDELDVDDMRFYAKDHSVFYLDWQWFESYDDNPYGLNSGSIIYKLFIRIIAEEVL